MPAYLHTYLQSTGNGTARGTDTAFGGARHDKRCAVHIRQARANHSCPDPRPCSQPPADKWIISSVVRRLHARPQECDSATLQVCKYGYMCAPHTAITIKSNRAGQPSCFQASNVQSTYVCTYTEPGQRSLLAARTLHGTVMHGSVMVQLYYC